MRRALTLSPLLSLTLTALVGFGCARTEQRVAPPPEFTLSGPAKRLCSGIWVSRRADREALMRTTVLWREDQVRDYERGALAFDVDEELRVVTATREGVSARARYLGDQGCVILPQRSDSVFFTPREVVSALPDAETTPWPMGELLPDAPTPDDVDAALLERAIAKLFERPDDNRAAFVVVHRGRIIAERYGEGVGRDTQLESWSMGKSLTATLIGRLIQLGLLELDQPAPVPAWRDAPGDPRGEIRVADLLRMSSGLRFSPTNASPERLAGSFVPGQPDHRLAYVAPINAFTFVTTRPLEHPPGAVGRYRNCDPLTLGYIVRRTVERELGESYHTWPQRQLFDKLGIREFTLETDAYGNFLLTGYNFGTARHWARLGMLYLQRGEWNGERLLPEDFVDFVSGPAPAWRDGAYGGLFWRNAGHREIKSLPRDTYFADGAGHQSTFIIPSRELVIVVMNHRSPAAAAPGRWRREVEALGLTVKAVDPSWSW